MPLGRPERRTPAEITADEAIALLRPRIEPELVGMAFDSRARGGGGGWKQRNRRVIAEMAEAGMSAEEIVQAWEASCERRSGAIVTMMRWVQEDLNRPEFEWRRRDATPDLPRWIDLKASGEYDDVATQVAARRAAAASAGPLRFEPPSSLLDAVRSVAPGYGG